MADLKDRSTFQPQEPSRELRSAARCAEVMFVLVVLLAIATLALNKAVAVNWAETDARYQWYEDTGSMLARFRAFRNHSPRFYEGLVISALTRSPVGDETQARYPSLAALVKSGPIEISRRPDDGSVFNIRGGATSNDLLSELGDAATEFGGLAAQILQSESDPSRRVPLLRAAVGQTFKNEDARRFLQEEVAPALAHIDEPAQWAPDRKSAWIVFGEWPPVISGILRPVPGSSYANRYFPSADLEAEKRFLSELVGGTSDATELERILDTAWRDAFGRLKAIPTGDPQIGVPGSGMSFSATDIVMLSGPLLVLIQAFFAMFWVRHWSNQADANQATIPSGPPAAPLRVFIFPFFANPIDPLSKPIPRTVVDVAQRLTWLLCLSLPVVVLSLALITRYDLSGVTRTPIHHGDDFPMNAMVPGEWLPPASPTIARLSALRDHDALSTSLDALNMIALLASLILMIEITTVDRQRLHPPPYNVFLRRAILVALCFWVLSIWLWAIHLDKSGTFLFGWFSLSDLVFWLSFGITWIVGGFTSFSRRARLPLAASIVGLVVLLALLRPT